MNQIGLSRCPNIRTEKDPSFGALDHCLTAFEIRIHSHKSKFMTAHSREVAVAQRLHRSQSSHYFQPANKPAALLAYALPPPAAWRHENKRGKTSVASGDFGGNVERLCRSSCC